MLLRTLSLGAALLVCYSATAQQVSPRARMVVQTIQELRSIALPSPEDIEQGPPAKVPGLLRRLNHDLRELVIETLNDRSRRGVPDEEEITGQLRAAGWNEIPQHKWNAYGEIIGIGFDLTTGYQPEILIVSTRLWIPCGSADPDSAIYVFRGRAREWELLLAADVDYDSQGAEQGSGLEV